MKYILRDYQQECVDTILREFETLNSQLIQLPTGAGKTVILWHYLKASGLSATIVAPSKELVEQIYRTGCDVVGEDFCFMKDNDGYPAERPKYLIITSMSLQIMVKKGLTHLLPCQALIIDEAHRSRAIKSELYINYFRDIGAKILGLTATPVRLDGKSLFKVFEKLTYKKGLIDLIKSGDLCELFCYNIRTSCVIQGSDKRSDFTAETLRLLDVDSRNHIILETYLKYCQQKKTLIFCLSVKHAVILAEKLKSFGFLAESIHCRMSYRERDDILRRFHEGKIHVLTNCQILTEGFDEPSIEALILARPTMSTALFMQMIGRGVRNYPGKEGCSLYNLTDRSAKIIDFNSISDFEHRGPPLALSVEDGEPITSFVERQYLSIEDKPEVEAVLESSYTNSISAFKYQKDKLLDYGINIDSYEEFKDGLSFDDASYLLFKARLFERNGFKALEVMKNVEK